MLLDVQDLHVTFLSTGREVVRGVDLQMEPGERWGLVGESGSGKTVTAMALSGLLERRNVSMRGHVLFDGQDLLACSREQLRSVQGKSIGVVFQEPMTSLNPLMKVGRQVEEVLRIHTDLSAAERRQRVLQAMAEVELPDPEQTYEKYPHQLSGGQRQRAVIASAMIIHPRLLICDEPTTALDVTVQAQILQLLRSASDRFDVAILLISHDLSVVRRLCEQVAVMYQGQIVERGQTEGIFQNPRDPYTRRLIEAIPKKRKRHE